MDSWIWLIGRPDLLMDQSFVKKNKKKKHSYNHWTPGHLLYLLVLNLDCIPRAAATSLHPRDRGLHWSYRKKRQKASSWFLVRIRIFWLWILGLKNTHYADANFFFSNKSPFVSRLLWQDFFTGVWCGGSYIKVLIKQDLNNLQI